MDCPQFDSPDTAAFYARLQAARAGQHLALSGSIELTFRCNLRCVHCYVGDSRCAPPQAELSTVEVKHLLDQLCDAGCLWLLFTGGEPLLRPDFVEIYRYARRKGFVVSFFTNGTLLTPQIADAVAEYPPHLVEITLYGYSQETYERVTGIPGSHARCMRGIDLLLERNLRFKLKTMALSLNIHELTAMQDFASQLGVDFRFDPLVVAQLDGGATPMAVRLSPEQVVQSDLNTPGRSEGYLEAYQRFANGKPDPKRLYSCQAGTSSFHIDPAGQLSPCMISRSKSFDLRQGTFEEGWNRFLPMVTAQPRLTVSECEGCKLLAICGQCPGWATLELGDPEKRVDYICQIAHLRAKTFGLTA